MSRFVFCFLTTVLFVSLSLSARAELHEYVFDPAHTRIVFSISHLGFSNQFGEFLEFDGGFTFDPDSPEASTVMVEIDTDSINLANSKAWHDHMINEDFFNAAKYPKMTFKSTQIEKTGEKTGRLTGNLTLLGVTKPVTLEVAYNAMGTHPYNKNVIAGFSATGTLKRSDFGMTYGLPGVGDEVTLYIEVEGIRKTPAPPNEDG